MIKLAIRNVKLGQEGHLRAWMAELNRRSAEVRETFAQEGVRHEQAYLLKTAEGAVLICCMNARQKTMPANKAAENVVCP